MPEISPENYTFTKKVNASLEISLTYGRVPDHPELFECIVELTNVHESGGSNEDKTGSKTGENGEIPAEISEESTGKSTGWLSSLWGSENSLFLAKKEVEVPLLLGYMQMLGTVRLNHQIGAETGSESSLGVYWKNSEYTSSYCSPEADEKVQAILHTELFKNNSGDLAKQNQQNQNEDQNLKSPDIPITSKVGGVPDLHANTFDPTAHYLLHDLVHPFGTMEMPRGVDLPPLPTHQQEELATSLSQFVVPFYVTAQHLLFASTTLMPGQKCVYKFHVDVPPETLPPSYNTKLTGSVGDAGLASIVYLFVIGVQEEVNGEMKHRAVYFPLEFRPGHYGLDRMWLQHNYLQSPLLDKNWCPQKIHQQVHSTGTVSEEKEIYKKNKVNADIPATKIANVTHNHALISNTRKDAFLTELDALIGGSLETVAATERRKSSVSYVSPQDRGLLVQTPVKPRVLYQIRVNNLPLCVLTLSAATYHVGEDVHFFLKLHPDFRTQARVVGFTAHIEAHEIFHVGSEREIVNIYKVSPTVKANTYADALMFPFAGDQAKSAMKTGDVVNLPRFLTQQFQASSFMDLRYFMVFRFVLNDFPEMEAYRIDEDPKAFAEYVLAYKLDSEGNEFKFLVPLTVLP